MSLLSARRALLIPLLSGAVVVVVSAQPTPARVLVMPFAVEVDGASPGSAGAALWLGEAAALLVTEGLTAQGVAAFPRSERLAAFDRLDLPMSSVLTRATMIRVAELIGATEIIFGDVRLGDRLEVRARTIRVTAGAEAPVVEAAGLLAELFRVFATVTAGLAMSPAPGASGSEAVAPLDLETFENYVKGLVSPTLETRRRFLEAAMVRAPRAGGVLIELWRVYTALGAHDKALEVASAVPPGAREARPARLAVALSLVELGRIDGALRELSMLQAQRPSALVANAAGVVELRRGGEGLETAVAQFEHAVRLEPANTDYQFNLGYAYARRGDRDRALATLREAVRIDAADPESHAVMAVLLASAGRSSEARRERDLAVLLGATAGIDPAATDVPAGLERLPPSLEVDFGPRAASAGDHPGQRGDERVTAAFHLSRARSLMDARRDRDAIDALRRAVYLDPYADEPHLLLGLIYHRNGRLADAVDEFRVALWARESVEAHVALGHALLEGGDRDGARRSAERALEMDAASVEARELLNRIGGQPRRAAVLPSRASHVG
ncbi:MAG TPA: tetratricopeptide repeat protein [Vicinamibacterales bacterium]|nr:tetratricopeptide repeat protein [Vicinamibacterales bacterium]